MNVESFSSRNWKWLCCRSDRFSVPHTCTRAIFRQKVYCGTGEKIVQSPVWSSSGTKIIVTRRNQYSKLAIDLLLSQKFRTWFNFVYCKSRMFRMIFIFVYFVRGRFRTKIISMRKAQSKSENQQQSETVRKCCAYERSEISNLWKFSTYKIFRIYRISYFLLKKKKNEI